MDRVVRVAVIGSGSIGRRHVSALLARADVERVTVVTSWADGAAALPDDPRLEVVAPDAAFEADAAIVAVETDRHVAAAMPLLERGIDTLIEKPLSHTRDGLDALVAAAQESGARVFIGYNLRFLPAVRMLRGIVGSGVLGRVLYARFEAGQWLPDWRPGRDYRETYSASAARGGGVALDLSHEIDAMCFVLGDPRTVSVERRHVSDLEIDSDDLFEGRYDLPGGGMASVHLDYLAPRRVRTYRALGSDGEAVCDIANGTFTVTRDGVTDTHDDAALFDVAATYPAQVDAFLAAHAGGAGDVLATLADGVRVLELLEDAHA